MPVTCRVKVVEPQRLASRAIRCPAEEFSEALTATLEEVWDWLNTHEHVTAGPPIASYHNLADDEVELRAGFPIAEAIEPAPPFEIASLPGGRAATALLEGPYSLLGAAYAELAEFIQRERLQPMGRPYDIYWVDPTQVDTEDQLRTEVVWPVA